MREGIYDVWFVPTEEAKKLFNWTEHRVNHLPFFSKEDAQCAASEFRLDDAGLCGGYANYEVRERMRLVH